MTHFNKYIFLALSIFFLNNKSNAQLSDQAQISLLTCAEGEDIYSLFGHSAIRVNDPVNNIDNCYNWGMFEFDSDEIVFATKFTKGRLKYYMDEQDFGYFMMEYDYFQRTVKEQLLNLTHEQKNNLWKALKENYLPENRVYKYDFFFDNCATKMRDIVHDVVGADLIFSGDYLTEKRSFRDLLREMNGAMPWISLGMDIALGAPIDPKATPEEHMFLPNYVLSGFENATVMKNGIDRPAIKSERMIFQPVEKETKKGLLRPIVVFSVLMLMVLGLTFRDYKNKSRSKYLDFIIFLITGIVGVLVILLWTATEHDGMRNNLNVLWAFAPNLVVAFYLLKTNPPKWVRSYARLTFILLIMMVLIWTVGVQVYSTALIPFVLLVGLRYFFLWQKGLAKP